jgi:hypothetical protein
MKNPRGEARRQMVEMVRRGESQRAVARNFRVSLHTVQRWCKRAKELELDAVDWSERSHLARNIPNKTPVGMERSNKNGVRCDPIFFAGHEYAERQTQAPARWSSGACGNRSRVNASSVS